MRKKIIALTTVMILGVSSMTFNSFATNVKDQNNQHNQMKERPERQKNEIFGKITAISESSVTISVAERKKPEDMKQGFGTPPEKPANDNGNNTENNNNDNSKEPPKQLTDEQIAEMKKNLENMFTLTGETKIIDISSAKFDDFGRGFKGENKGNQNNSPNNNDKQKVEKTYKDYQVGDYISIELESETSTKAKSVRDAFMVRGGMPRGGMQKDFKDKKDNATNNSNQ